MADEIRPVHIHRTRRVRRLSRDEGEENEERFQKKLAELADMEEEQQESESHDEPQSKGGDRERSAERDSPMGRHLDVET